MTDEPFLPYAGTSGWAGSETSRLRAVHDDTDGTTKVRQRETLRVLHQAGTGGLTWKELAERKGLHHGQASGVLSVLHKEGKVARLTTKRNACAVYVLEDYVRGRAVAPHRSTQATRDREALQRVIDLVDSHGAFDSIPVRTLIATLDGWEM